MKEIDKLIKELNELSEFEKQNKERMKEIAHILVSYYRRWNNVKGAEKKSAEDDLESIA